MSNLTPNQNLLLEYDRLFNETNTKYNKKNRELKTKNKLLEINQKSNLAKMETIKILQYIFGFLLLTAVVVWMHLSGFISLTGMIVVICVIAIVLFVMYYKNNKNTIEDRINKSSSEAGDDLWKTFEEGYLSLFGIGGYSCSEYCPSNSEEEGSFSPIIPKAKPRFLRTDSQRDVWLKGNLPSTTYTADDEGKRFRIDGELVKGFGYDKNLYNSPSNVPTLRNTVQELEDNREQKEIIPISKNYATYYNCQFVGGNDSSSKVPFKSNYKYTTIPCDNYPGFIQTNKFICKKDPVKYGESECDEV